MVFIPIPLLDGDIIIRKVSNGWWVGRLDTFANGEARLVETVFEEPDRSDQAKTTALVNLVADTFALHIQGANEA